MIILVVKRELLLSVRKYSNFITPLFFFIAVVCFFPLASTANNNTLSHIGVGVIWVAALLATMLSLPRLFQEDYADGTLDLLLLSDCSLSVLMFAKVIAQWLMFALPLIIISPILAMMYQLPYHSIIMLMLSLLLGTPTLILVGGIAAALTVSLRNNGLLLAILVFPLYIPILIFGAAVPSLSAQGLPVIGILAILAALMVLAIGLAPLATAFAVRVGINYQK